MNRSRALHVCWIVVLVSLIAMTPHAVQAAPSTQTATPDAVVIVKGLNLRQGPGKQFPVITVLGNKTSLKVIGRSDPTCQWVQVQTVDGNQQGWVAGGAAFIRLNIPCANFPDGTASAAPSPTVQPTSPALVRPTSGTILKDNRGSGGRGELTIENLTEEDGVVALIRPEDPKNAIIAFYIRHRESFTIGGVPNGHYNLVFTTGQGWDEAQHKFTMNERYQRFKEPDGQRDAVLTFTGNERWTATLHGVEHGEHPIQKIGEGEFPDL
jgi:hypothetical protein